MILTSQTVPLIIPSRDFLKDTKSIERLTPPPYKRMDMFHSSGRLLLSSRRVEQTLDLGMRDVESSAYLPQALPLAV
jgi:hypothetical protein